MATAKLSQRTLSPLSTSRDNMLTSTGPKENQENKSKESAKNISHSVGGKAKTDLTRGYSRKDYEKIILSKLNSETGTIYENN